MYNIFIFILSLGLVLASLFLILLVLVQLPKKEAGLGQAFGSGATDALFGPGSGNMLTKLTKWTAGIFFALTIVIWMLQGHNARAGKAKDVRSVLTAADKAASDPVKPAPATNLLNTNFATTAQSNVAGTNIPAVKPPTNATPPK